MCVLDIASHPVSSFVKFSAVVSRAVCNNSVRNRKNVSSGSNHLRSESEISSQLALLPVSKV